MIKYIFKKKKEYGFEVRQVNWKTVEKKRCKKVKLNDGEVKRN